MLLVLLLIFKLTEVLHQSRSVGFIAQVRSRVVWDLSISRGFSGRIIIKAGHLIYEHPDKRSYIIKSVCTEPNSKVFFIAIWKTSSLDQVVG